MKLIKSVSVLAVLILSACGGEEEGATKNEPVAQKRDCTITYGWEARKPYQFFENKKMQGIDVDLLAQAANESNCDLAFVEKTWNELLVDVESGKVDVIAGATKTDERAKYADFSVPYREESFVLFVQSNSQFADKNIVNFLSLGNKIGVASGYYYGNEVADLMDHAQYSQSFVSSKTNEANFYNVEYGRVHGVLVDPVEGRYIIKRKGLGSKMKASAIEIPADAVTYMFSQKSKHKEQLDKIKAGIEQMVANKVPQKIINNYQ